MPTRDPPSIDLSEGPRSLHRKTKKPSQPPTSSKMCIQGRFSPHGTIPPSSAFHPSIGQHNVYSASTTTACIVSASYSDENICVFDFTGWRGKRFSLSKPDEADIQIACTIILYQPIYRIYNISVCAPVASVCL